MRIQLSVFFVLLVSLSACASVTATSAPTQTFEILTSEIQVTSSYTPLSPSKTPTLTPLPVETIDPLAWQATPESLLPADFAVRNGKEFLSAILPYCYVRVDLDGEMQTIENFKKSLDGDPLWEMIKEKYASGKIRNAGVSVVSVPSGGGCGIITITETINGRGVKTGGYFQSRLGLHEWIWVKFTEPY